MIDKVIEQLISVVNHLLAQDKTQWEKLIALDKTYWQFYIADLDLMVNLKITTHGFKLLKMKPKATAKISGRSLQYLAALKSGGGDDLVIEGDAALSHQLIKILRQTQIDWEELIAPYSGDVVAHGLGDFARGLKNIKNKVCQSLGRQTSEYLQFESNHFPCAEEVHDFQSDVQTLRDDVARIDARIQKLKTRKKA